jgi:hypothetical protein
MHEIWTQGADFGRFRPIFAEDQAQTAGVNCDYADQQNQTNESSGGGI